MHPIPERRNNLLLLIYFLLKTKEDPLLPLPSLILSSKYVVASRTELSPPKLNDSGPSLKVGRLKLTSAHT
jgi:hypothetical protein